MSANKNVDLDLNLGDDDIVLVDEKALTWFDVSAIGTGEMLFTGGWAWIAYIAVGYGIKWTFIGFCEGALIINLVWWLYREMITAVPEPGSIQSYGREAGMFSLGTAYLVCYAPVYGVFLWIEVVVSRGLLHILIPGVPEGIWPYVVVLPVLAMNLYGHQITGKVQAILVVLTLIGDIFIGAAVWLLMAHHATWAANWASPTPIGFWAPFRVAALWMAIMAAVMEVQQVLVDEWKDFRQSRDIGLLTASWQLWIRQIPLAFGLMAALPLGVLASMSVPTVEAIKLQIGGGFIFYTALVSMLIATYTCFSVYFMAESKVLALYAQQGALPRIFGAYSQRAVPWFSTCFLAVVALIGAYVSDYDFVIGTLTEYGATLYLVISLFYLGMHYSKTLERPHTAKFGVPIAIFVLLFTTMMTLGALTANWKAGCTWLAVVVVVCAYDYFIVPRTKRGGFYRAQVLRRRTSAARF